MFTGDHRPEPAIGSGHHGDAVALVTDVAGFVLARVGRNMTRSGGPGPVAYELAEDVRRCTGSSHAGARRSSISVATGRAGIGWLMAAGRVIAIGALLAGARTAAQTKCALVSRAVFNILYAFGRLQLGG